MRVRSAAFGWGSAALLGGALLLGSVSCQPKYAPDQPVKQAPEGCCKFGNETMTKFAGCRLTHRCKEDEPIWLRGAVSCGVLDEARCGGGRCCKFEPLYGAPGSVLNWEDDDDDAATPGATPPTRNGPKPVAPAVNAAPGGTAPPPADAPQESTPPPANE